MRTTGLIADQGVHIGDVVHWYLGAREPRSVSASAQWVRLPKPDPEQLPDSWAITWQYDKFVMSFANACMPLDEFPNTQGNYFYGTEGVLHINRNSYTLKPLARRVSAGAAPPAPAFEPLNKRFGFEGWEPADAAHIRNFLDCVKSRQKPKTDVETGFYSTLPLLLGVLAVRNGKMYNWNGKQAVACG